MRVYGLKNCDTCRKAMKALPAAELVDVRETPLGDGVLDHAFRSFGTALLNTKSATWRSLSEAEREEDPLELIRAHPAVMKRPLIADGEDLYLGWTPETRAALGVA